MTSRTPLPYKKLINYVAFLFGITVLLRLLLVSYYLPDAGGIDMNVVFGIQRLLLGQPLYQSTVLPPYAVIQYTPLFYHTAAATARLFGVSGMDVYGVYTVAHALALAANLLTVVLAAAIIRCWSFSWKESLVFAFPVLMMLTTHYYLRGDSLHLLFFATAAYALVRYARQDAWYWLVLAAVASACCIMTKQSGILIAGIAGFYLLFLERRVPALLLYGVCWLLSGFLVYKACVGQADELCYQNAWLGLKNGMDLSFLYVIFSSQFYFDLIPCYVLGGLMVYTALRHTKDKQYRLLVAGAACSFLFAVVTGLKIGSSNNYFTEFLFFVLLCLPFLLSSGFSGQHLFRLRRYQVTIGRFGLIALFILVSSKTMGLFTSMYIEKRLVSQQDRYNRDLQLLRYFEETLQLKSGQYVYFNESGFLNNIFLPYTIMATKDVSSQVYRCDPHTYDYRPFIAGMNNGLVSYIVVDTAKNNINAFEPELPFIHFEPERFLPVAEVSGYRIYQYRGVALARKSTGS